MENSEELKKLYKSMEEDKTLPLIYKPEDIIPGSGDPNAQVMLIGEAGGYQESVERKPFVGRAGQLLNQLLQDIDIKREDVYITNMLKVRPPENRDPSEEELKAYEKYLDQEIEIIKPKVIITLGRFSMNKFFPDSKISQIHGKAHKIDWKGLSVTVIPMFHPAAALRNPEFMKHLKEDFKNIPKVLKQVIAS